MGVLGECDPAKARRDGNPQPRGHLDHSSRTARQASPRVSGAKTDSAHDYPIAPNLLSTSNVPIKPDEVWGTEITYLETGKDWLYLTGILDLYSRRFDQAGAWDRAWRLRYH